MRSLLVHLRLHFQLLLAPVFLWGWLVAGGGFSPVVLLGFISLHAFLYSGATAFNSYFDRDVGPVGGLEHPPQVESVLLPFSIAVQAVGWLLAWFVNVPFWLAYGVFAALSFVAGFIGSPAMNLFPGQLAAENGGRELWVQTSGLKLKLPEVIRAKLASQTGREIVFGVRPEHIRSKGEIRDPDPTRTATVNVSVVEPLGSEVYAYLSANGHEFVSRMDATANPRAGQTIETVFDTDHLHVFDKETEQALT